MRTTLLITGIAWLIVFLAAQSSPLSQRLSPQLLTMLAVGIAAWGAFFFLAKRLSAAREERDIDAQDGTAPPSPAWAPRNLGFLLAAFAATSAWLGASSGSGSFILVESGYYCLLFFTGHALRRFGRSAQYVPLLYGLLLLAAATYIKVSSFMNSPGARFQFGPEIVLFAIARAVSGMAMLPLDVAVLWGGWAISNALPKRHAGNSSAPDNAASSPPVKASKAKKIAVLLICLGTVLAISLALVNRSKSGKVVPGSTPTDSLSALLADLKSDLFNADLAARAIDENGADEVVPEMIKALKDNSAIARMNAAGVLGKIGPEALQSIPALIDSLENDTYPLSQESAAMALGRIGTNSSEAFTALSRALSSEKPYIRAVAVEALGEMGPNAKGAVPVLTGMLNIKEERIWHKTMKALGNIGPDSQAAVPALFKAFKEDIDTEAAQGAADLLLVPHAQDYYIAAGAISKIAPVSPEHEEILAILIRNLSGSNVRVQAAAAATIAEMGASAKPAVPAIITAADSPDYDVRKYAVAALGKISPDPGEALPVLIKAVNKRDVYIGRVAAHAIGNMGADAKEAVPALIEAVSSNQWTSRYSAAEALGRIGQDAKAAVPVLTAALNDKLLRPYAAEALGAIGPAAKEAVPPLIAMLKEIPEARDMTGRELRTIREPSAGAYAAKALGGIGPEAKDAVPALIQALNHSDFYVRRNSAEALGKIGPDAIGAEPALRKAVADSSKPVRATATEALRRIAPVSE